MFTIIGILALYILLAHYKKMTKRNEYIRRVCGVVEQVQNSPNIVHQYLKNFRPLNCFRLALILLRQCAHTQTEVGTIVRWKVR